MKRKNASIYYPSKAIEAMDGQSPARGGPFHYKHHDADLSASWPSCLHGLAQGCMVCIVIHEALLSQSYRVLSV